MPWHRKRVKRRPFSEYLFITCMASVGGGAILAFLLWAFSRFTEANFE